jgi:membrane-anchored protein YejM (alkaline phosphatase superfamily)
VRYTDWAINRFLEGARQRPWFKDTVFVVMADHCARSGGQMELPIENFRIPLFVYAPGIIQPERVARLASQIDLAPTLLDLLGFDYDSTFFGRSLFDPRHEPRALTASYSSLGLFRDNRLTVLLPKQQAVEYAIDRDVEMPIQLSDADLAEAISYYQSASDVYRAGGLRTDRVVPGQLAK